MIKQLSNIKTSIYLRKTTVQIITLPLQNWHNWNSTEEKAIYLKDRKSEIACTILDKVF